jgi:predicted phage terminase large subunit-like protein
LELLDAEIGTAAREDFLSFVLYVRAFYRVAWFHRVLCDKLDRFVRGEIPFLMVFEPPRHGKSELTSRCLPAYIFGRNPDANIIATSYSSDLASIFNRDVQRIMDSWAYRQVFPETTLGRTNIRTVAGSWLRNSDIFEIVGRRGSYRSAGVGGGITGMGGNYILMDDVIKNHEEANSPTYREKVWQWYKTTLRTRLEGTPCGMLLTVTRWHEDDLAGRILREMKDEPEADQWEIVSFPAIKEEPPSEADPREEGEALWPEAFSTAKLAPFKIDTQTWNALFQQRPSSPEGNRVKRHWIQYYGGPGGRPLPEELTNKVQSWDLNFGKKAKSADASYVVGQCWAEHQADIFLLDQMRYRGNHVQNKKNVKAFAKRWGCTTVLVEDAASGAPLVVDLKGFVRGIIAVPVRGTKEARFDSVAPLFEAGNVWLPHPSIAPWVGEFVEEIVTFPFAKFDDQADTLSQALQRYKTKSRPSMKLDLSIGAQANPWSY